jgi:hypothetical protein
VVSSIIIQLSVWIIFVRVQNSFGIGFRQGVCQEVFFSGLTILGETQNNFFDLVAPVWQSEYRGNTAMTRWQNKIRRTRNFFRGWAKNLVS